MMMMRNATTLSKIVMMIFSFHFCQNQPLHILSQLLSSSLYQHNAILKDAAHIKEPQNASLC